METKKDISYLGKDFNQFRKNLIDFTKQYFPNTYTDFNESDPGMMFMEMAAYVGDVLSFYADTNLKESLITQATERQNVFDIAKTLGYSPNDVRPAYVDLTVYQLVPSIGSGTNSKPDYTYALTIKPGMIVKPSSGNSTFRTLESVEFKVTSSGAAATVYETDPATGSPLYYLLQKNVRAVSGTIKTATFSFTDPIAYDKIILPETGVIEIVSVTDSESNTWYEVPYLAQDTVFQDIPNIIENDSELYKYRADTPFLLKLKQVSKRFVSKRRSDNLLEIQFGSGVSNNNDIDLIPNPTNVGNGLLNIRRAVDIDIDPANFMYTSEYGQAPSNTMLTVTYTVGNGLEDNINANSLITIDSIEYIEDINSNANAATVNFIKTTVTVNNELPAVGAKSLESTDSIKQNALANFSTQLRNVTLEDNIIRAYSMPAKYGSVAKAFINQDDQTNVNIPGRIPNPLALNMYVLSYNSNKQLTYANSAIKNNLKTYLNFYRILTDAINIKDAFIINIQVRFKIMVLPNYNSNEVLLKCINALKSFFDIDKWQINQPIIMSDIFTVIANTKGVQSVSSINIDNLYDNDEGYSGNEYNITTATKNGIIYPSLDPSIFEVKFPNKDIIGSVVNF
jgi:hypothetical protein